jgi:hypothetical protein
MDLFSWANDYHHAEVFVSCAMFSSGANHDLRAFHGILKKTLPRFCDFEI